MRLSIIIVNYNVRYFLEQCLHSVLHAVKGIEAELIVVDNDSSDDSIAYLQPLFPSVIFIANNVNTGFAKANNQALRVSRGEYILFLNPDTLVPEDCLEKCVAFLDAHPRTGALGVQMLDGRGRFLPESKRAFPSPMASLYKLTGVAAMFPRSGVFNRYALGEMDKDGDHEVPVLAGAFMMGRASVLQALGGFDEDFFLYGEDIDLSYRIIEAGMKNHYLGSAAIIHFKGESSAGAPLDRIGHFYSAMRIFVQKHYRGSKAGILWFVITLAIWCRAGLSLLARLVRPILLPLIDVGLVWLSLQTVRVSWIKWVRDGLDFHVPFISYALPSFALLFVMFAALAGLYDKAYRSSRTMVSLGFAWVAILAVYSLLPESLRFSRGVIITGSFTGALLILWFRSTLFEKWHSWFGYESEQKGTTIVVGEEQEYTAAKKILESDLPDTALMARLAPVNRAGDALGRLEDLPQLLRSMLIKEVLFCVGSLSLTEIIKHVGSWKETPRLLFHMRGSRTVVGSDMHSATGRAIGWSNNYRIAQPYQRRMKRLVDILVALLCMITAPLHLVFFKKPGRLFHHAWQVLTGKRTWVGYLLPEATLPPLRPAIIPQSVHLIHGTEQSKQHSDRIYALNYDWWQDLVYIFSRYRKWAG